MEFEPYLEQEWSPPPSSSVESRKCFLAQDEHPLCPVCKAQISHSTMVPLYSQGQGSSMEELEWKLAEDRVAVPPRPSGTQLQALSLATASCSGQQLPYRNPYQDMGTNPALFGNYRDENSPSPPLMSLTSPGIYNPTIGTLGEMVYARAFGNGLHGYTRPYHPAGSPGLRMRRQDVQADNSLNRVSVFLFCCFLLCLIVF
ncbi:hypothetical protein MLD38_021141 [Melastoma candidum]|uniref:Uncharacterized protein n=1 Tax=Melastoma candidum TaxID=119954 RepID=A0ACB9QGE4_9MYRT|nr:hypothetical protein MLD38_021141 [Melastoma candidum]